MAQRSTNNPECRALAAVIARNLRKRRLAHGLSQAEVAEVLGVSVESFSRIERGLSLPSFPTLLRMATMFGAQAGDLLKSEGEPEMARRQPRVTADYLETAPTPTAIAPQHDAQQAAVLFLRIVDASRTLDAARLEKLAVAAEELAK